MTDDFDFYCKRCEQKVTHEHFCTNVAEAHKYTCEYCGEKDVNHRHMCKPKLEKITHYCGNCGAVGTHEGHLCNPIPIGKIKDEIKKKWAKVKDQTAGKKLSSCKVCGQPVGIPGHYCDRKTPFKCEYCGVEVSNSYHLCKQMMGKFKYICKTCSRLGIKATDVCAPREL